VTGTQAASACCHLQTPHSNRAGSKNVARQRLLNMLAHVSYHAQLRKVGRSKRCTELCPHMAPRAIPLSHITADCKAAVQITW
jgi:hypothetical protein